MPLAMLLSFGALGIEGRVIPAAGGLAILGVELGILARRGGAPTD